jgi:hypothetical protein
LYEMLWGVAMVVAEAARVGSGRAHRGRSRGFEGRPRRERVR